MSYIEHDLRDQRKRGRPKVGSIGPDGKPVVRISHKRTMEDRFKFIQTRVLKELDARTRPGEMDKMDLDDLAKVLKACRENLHTIHQKKLLDRQEDQIEFVTVVPMEKGEVQ